MSLDALFSPRGVAVIGASNRELTIGYRIIQNLLDFGYTGPVYPVNPKGGEIRGLKAFTSIGETPDPVDVAHIVIKNTLVPGCVKDCAKKGIKAVIVNTAGFREIGPEGAALEDQLLAISRETGIRIFGPNCQGVINSDPAVRAYCNFTYTRPSPGRISIVAQSGGVGEVIHQRIVELGIGVRKYASNGNGCDVSIPEIIRHYAEDDETRVIVAYIESLPDPRAFLEAAMAVSRRKPILAMKVGRTAEGAKAVTSHTGGMIKQDTAIDLVFEKAGVVAFRDVEELCQAAIGFASQPVPAGNRVGMIANTGGPAIIATDVLIEGGMSMPPLSPKTAAFLKEKLYPEASINNPVDVLATAGPEHFAAAMQALLDDDGIDVVFLNFITPFFVDTLGVAKEIAAANRRALDIPPVSEGCQGRAKKPIVATVMTEKVGWKETLNVIRAAGVPVYDMPDMGARVLAAMGRYATLRNRPIETPVSFPGVDPARARAILSQPRPAKAGSGSGPRPARAGPAGGTSPSAGETLSAQTLLPADQAYDLLACYGIPVARHKMVRTVAECVAAADQIGYPVVLKVDAQTVIHKTDSGGVVLNIRDAQTLRGHAQRLLDRFAANSPRLLVQEQLIGGTEVIVGAQAVPGLGHIVMFGLGGIYTEVLKDVAFKLTPVTQSEAARMVGGLRAGAILTGVRGKPGVDIAALTQIIQRVSQMLVDNPGISELDINPLIALPTGAMAVDVRMMI